MPTATGYTTLYLTCAARLSPGLPRHKAQDAVGSVVCRCDKTQEAVRIHFSVPAHYSVWQSPGTNATAAASILFGGSEVILY